MLEGTLWTVVLVVTNNFFDLVKVLHTHKIESVTII